MFHQFNRVTGRLAAATHLTNPLFPVAPLALQRAEPPTIVYTANQLSTVTETIGSASKQRLMPGTNIPYASVPESLRKKQEKFQKEDGVPVFLKGGAGDVFLYRLTLILCAVGLVGVFELFYDMAVPKKPQ